MDDDCDQRILSVAHHSTAVDNSCSETVVVVSSLMPSQTGHHINIYSDFVFETWISPQKSVWADLSVVTESGGSECGNRISSANLLTVFHSNSGSILLSFRDVTTGQITRDVQKTEIWFGFGFLKTKPSKTLTSVQTVYR